MSIDAAQQVLASIDGEQALVVEARVVRRIMREQLDVRGLATQVPHIECASVPRDVLVALVDEDELGVRHDSLPLIVTLVALPEDDELDALGLELADVLWRRVFHARVDEACVRALGPDKRLSLELVDVVGQTPWDEAVAVLVDEERVLEDVGTRAAMVELIALYSELRFFAPHLIAGFLPALAGRPEVDAAFDRLVDARAIFIGSRPPSAADPIDLREHSGRNDGPSAGQTTLVPASRARKFSARAGRARGRGNDARAAVWYAAAARTDDVELAGRASTDRDSALEALSTRLSLIGGDAGPTAAEWSAAIAPLLASARDGMQRVEARLLYDLQRACVDHEREAFQVHLGRWISKLGREPLERPLPTQRMVYILRHLIRAKARLPACNLAGSAIRSLQTTLKAAVSAVRKPTRASLSDSIGRCLDDAGLRARNIPEDVGRDKLIAELVDRVIERGFIAFGDVRDGLARNDLKLSDLDGVGELIRGDALLRLDKILDRELDAAYRRGEVYRRGLQRLSSLGFANVIGRTLVRFVILPFGAAFVLVEGAQHMVGPVVKMITGEMPVIFTLPRFLIVGGVLLALIHSADVRRWSMAGLRGIGDALKAVFVTLPTSFMRWGPVVWARSHPIYVLLRRFVLKPAIAALFVALIVWLCTDIRAGLWTWLGVTLLISLVLNSRQGRRVEELVSDRLLRSWHRLRYNIVPGIISGTLRLFKSIVTFVEVRLYQVDQWLRFRTGQNPVTLAFKAVATTVWSFFAYLVRLYINLLVEPQVNPIKHFPVVTVSHKIILPLTLVLTELLAAPLMFLGPVAANAIAGTTVVLLPGVFGFLVWEFKETWRIYDGNRKQVLAPVRVGSHGETIYRFLRPGFHSGTVPKLYAKLRVAERRRNAAASRKHHEALHHVSDDVERFVERGLLAILGRTPHFDRSELNVTRVGVTPYRIAVTIEHAGHPDTPVVVAFDEQSRYLVAGLSEVGWLASMTAAGREAFEAALTGLYKYAGVDLVREHIVSLLPGRPSYDIADRGLVVWPSEDYSTEALYPLRHRGEAISAVDADGPSTVDLPELPRERLFFKKRTVSWKPWLEVWEEQGTIAPIRDALGELSVLDDDALGNAA